jgi:acetyltransferase-like isoleucine patch superfamily enzyme
MPIKTFRGKIANGLEDTIVLHTNDGSIGYKIHKLEVVTTNPVGSSPEAVVKVYKVSQSSIDNLIDFADNTLVASAFYENHGNAYDFGGNVIIADNVIFNQDIYITCSSTDGDMNYHLELEQIKLDLNENTVATLKDIRNLS